MKIEDIIEQLDQVQNGYLWIGTNYTKMLAQVDDNSAFIRPTKYLHSVAEIISHLTMWRKETILKINTGKGSKTDDCEENWLSNDKLQVPGWNAIKSEYDNTQKELIALLKTKDDGLLNTKYYDTDFAGYYPYSFAIYGMLHHDLYHLGQLGIILRHLAVTKTIS